MPTINGVEVALTTKNELIKNIKESAKNKKPIVRSSPIEREDGITPITPPKKDVEWFDSLKSMSKERLRNMGLRVWEGKMWLYPQEWYDYIPDGYPAVCIDGTSEPFQAGVSSDDVRFGLLAYGFIHD